MKRFNNYIFTPPQVNRIGDGQWRKTLYIILKNGYYVTVKVKIVKNQIDMRIEIIINHILEVRQVLHYHKKYISLHKFTSTLPYILEDDI